MQVVVIGNSGSGKSTYAKKLASAHQLTHLDLDSIMWVPNEIAVLRTPEEIHASLAEFVQRNDRWVVEGVYTEIMRMILKPDVELHFMNPGLEACLANNARRPWEPEKYATPELQQSMFDNLIAWVRDYYTRTDAWSYAAHRALFDEHAGAKIEFTSVPEMDR